MQSKLKDKQNTSILLTEINYDSLFFSSLQNNAHSLQIRPYQNTCIYIQLMVSYTWTINGITKVDENPIKRHTTYTTTKHQLLTSIKIFNISSNFHSLKQIPPGSSAKSMHISATFLMFGLIAISIEVARSTPLSNSHCSVRFQETFEETLRIKRTCEEALYDGCCQVR